MRNASALRNALLITTAIGASVVAQAALAQTPAPAAAAAEPASGALEEVVVTATRQSNTVNRVPLAVSAVTQKSIEAQGIKNVQDLARTVPGVTFSRTGNEGNPNVTIRGIGGNGATVGAATTGVYLDDTPLQRRNVNGLITGNGSPFPQLFDLERVEVLRGPQGTLYGGSSQGGTIRFITPTPSLTTYSGQARAEVSTTKDGGEGYEAGVAFGGPIVEDKLGARVSAFFQHRAGWIDALSKYDGHRFGKDINWGQAVSFRAAALWEVNDRLRITPAFYYSRDFDKNKPTWREDSAQYDVGGGTFNNSGTVNGVKYAFPNTVMPRFTTNAMPWYGPNTTDNGRYLSTTDVRLESSPRTTVVMLPTLTFDYNFDNMAAKSVTSIIHDVTEGWDFTQGSGGTARTGILPYAVQRATGYDAPIAQYLPGMPDIYGYYYYTNHRNGITEELRFNSTNTGAPFQWVSGLYYSNTGIHVHGSANWNENDVSTFLRGAPEAFFLGATPLPAFNDPTQTVMNDVSDREVILKETELAAFGEASYNFTDQLKLTVGARATRYTQRFDQIYGGAVAGAPPGYVGSAGGAPGGIVTNPNSVSAFPTDRAGCPTSAQCPLQYTTLNTSESPFTPKVGLSYQRTQNELYYVTYSEGFRVGGVNPPVPPLQCASDLAQLGLTATPTTYDSDRVKSYEGGAKLRLFDGRAQINSSVYQIDWNNIQFNLPLRGCGFGFLANAANARSQGFDSQITGRVGPMTLNANIAYTKAEYTKDLHAVATNNNSALLIRKGDNVGVPDWVIALGAQYNHTFANKYDFYARADYQYTGKYDRTTGVGTTSYNFYYHDGDVTRNINARVGVNIDKLEVAVFAQNLTNSQDYQNLNLGVNSNVFTATSFKPRTIGVQMNYRY